MRRRVGGLSAPSSRLGLELAHNKACQLSGDGGASMTIQHCTSERRTGESAARTRRKPTPGASALWGAMLLLVLPGCSGDPASAPTRGASASPFAAGAPGAAPGSITPMGATKTGTGAMTPAVAAAMQKPGATPSGPGMM